MLAAHRASREATRWLARGVASWSKFNPAVMSGSNPATVSNLGTRWEGVAAAAAAQLPPLCTHAAAPAAPLLCSVRRVGAE